MTASALSCVAQIGATTYDVQDAYVSLDEARAPFAAATLTLPYDPDTVDVLDPRQTPPPRVRVTLAQRFSGSAPMSVLNDAWAGMTMGDVSSALDGQTLATLTAAYGTAWNASGFRTTGRRTLDLSIRDRRIDHLDGTVEVDAASDEQLLRDGALVAMAGTTPAELTVIGAVLLVLDRLVPGAALATTTGDQTITADAAEWRPGVSGWDYLTPLTAAAGLRLWCDEQRLWHLAPPESIVHPGQVTLAATGTVTAATDTISRDSGEWADAVVVTYEWTDPSGVRHVQHDMAQAPGATRVLHVTRSTPYPRPGEAAARLRKLRGRGRVLDVEAVADPTVYPATAASLSVPDSPTQTGYVEAVDWNLPDDDMRVRTRGLVDTPATSWLAGPTGLAWTDLPPGMSWVDLTWTEEP